MISYILSSVVLLRAMQLSGMRYCVILMSCSYGVGSSPSGNTSIIPVRLISNIYRLSTILTLIVESPSTGYGTQITQALVPSLLQWKSKDSSILTFCEATHAVLVSELQLIFREEEREDRESHLQRIVTAYMVFAPLSVFVGVPSQMSNLFSCLALTIHTERCNLDENMAKLFRTLSPSEFSSCLRFVFEALSSKGVGSDDFARLIRLISLALHNAPESLSCLLSPWIRDNSYGKHRHAEDRSRVR